MENGIGVRNLVKPVPYSKVTQDMMKYGGPLPLNPKPLPSVLPQSKPTRSVGCRLPAKPLRRSAESCRSSDSYIREKFQPGPTRDLEKEKLRLQNLLATGKEDVSIQDVAPCMRSAAQEDLDPIQEVLDQIEERREFLADMAALGQEKQYIHIINTEISQKMGELEILERRLQARK
ncbi:UPF0193 protein EVG1-like isoform X2 [Synchiropus splendidus]|uniref:UPF0193 protein EVG1-like isoform X2 n=1 Tax=Synchiropus splendidus TaxID=270530 RepID=UPI00237EA78F|nr:UPF0193 protein EVG1-like isoform X2 [Synchiropus splendidus]